MEHIIIDAIENRNILEFNYNGYHKVVEPHTYGVSSKGNDNLSAYQTYGTSDRGGVPDWKLFTVNKIEDLKILDDTFNGTRNGYSRSDSRMDNIYAEL